MSANGQLQNAIIKQDLEGVKAAIADGADPNNQIHKGTNVKTRILCASTVLGLVGLFTSDNTFIGLCLQKGTPEILETLIEAGANSNKKILIAQSSSKNPFYETTPLLYAIHNNQTDFVRSLLKDPKIDPFKKGKLLLTFSSQNTTSAPFDHAKKKGNPEIIKMLEDAITNYVEIQKEQKIKEIKKEYEEKLSELGINAEDLIKPSKNKKEIPEIVKKFPTVFNPAKKH